MTNGDGPSLLIAWAGICRSGRIARLEQVIGSHLKNEMRESGVRSPREVLFELEALGYLQLNWNQNSWQAKPMSIHNLPGGQALALLTGCRPYSIVDDLERTGIVPLPLRPSTTGRDVHLPDSFLLTFDSYGDLQRAADELGIPYRGDIYREEGQNFDELLLPDDDSPGPNLSGAPIEVFNVNSLRFDRLEAPNRDGLYRQRSNGPARYWMSLGGQWFGTSRARGQWLQLYRSARRVLKWEPTANNDVGSFLVPMSVSLPGKQAGLLQGCSGVLPSRTGSLLQYENVPRGIASKISRSLLQGPIS